MTSISEKAQPPAKTAYHRSFTTYWYVFTSAILSFFFVTTLFFNGVLYHWKKKYRQDKTSSLPPDKNDNGCYDDVKSLKITSNLRYYALQAGLDLQEYKVVTKDGYPIYLQRLIDPQKTDEDRNGAVPILCQHGLLSSSGSFISTGKRSLPFALIRDGYDVWLGNNRCGFEAQHVSFEGNLMHNEKFWDWDIRDLAYYDLTCLIDSVLSHKPHHDKLILVGHAQGCTQSFLMLKNPELASYHDKVSHFVALTPAVFPGVLFHHRKFLKFFSKRSQIGFKLFFGICCFLKMMTVTRNRFFGTTMYGIVCVIMFNYLFEWNGAKWNRNPKVWHINFVFNVSFVSAKLMTWWVSEWRSDSFYNQLLSKEAFDKGYNWKLTDEEKYNVKDDDSFFSFKQQWFNTTVVPMIIFNGEIDDLVDGKRLATHMTNFEPGYVKDENLFIYQLQEYSHMDVLWADDVQETIGKEMVRLLTQ